MKLIRDYILVKVMFESRDYKRLFDSKYIVMSITTEDSDEYIKITAVKGEGFSAKRRTQQVPMSDICTKEIVRSMKSNFKFDLALYIK